MEEAHDTFFQELLNDHLGRNYLNHLGDPEGREIPRCKKRVPYRRIRFQRLPIPPAKSESYELLSKWQSVLSSAHTIGHKAGFLLLRRGGRTRIYLGTYDPAAADSAAVNQLAQTAGIHMQGSEFAPVPDDESDWLGATLESLPDTGVMTGLPSPRFRTEGYVNLLQTLDRLTYGIRDEIGQRDYALIVLAEPVRDEEICALNNTFLQLRSDIHRCVVESVGANTGQNSGNNVGTGGNLGGLIVAAKAIAGDPAVLYGEAAGKKTQFNVDYGHHWGRSFGTAEQLYNDQCRSCWAQRLCPVCFKFLLDADGAFLEDIPSHTCENILRTLQDNLEMYCEIAGRHQDVYRKLFNAPQ